MTLERIALVYLAIGVLVAVRTWRRAGAGLDAVLAIFAWPLLVPTWSSSPSPAPRDEAERLVDAVREGLRAVRDAAAGSPFATLLGTDAESRLLADLERAAERMRAIDAELAGTRASPRGASTAALHDDAEASLRAIAAADRAAMKELVELLAALRARIVLARHAGSASEGPAALATELWARIEGLGEAVACARASSSAADASPLAPP